MCKDLIDQISQFKSFVQEANAADQVRVRNLYRENACSTMEVK